MPSAAKMILLISIVVLSLLTVALCGDVPGSLTPAPPLCKHRHARCQRYQHECSMVSCCNPLRTAGYQAAPASGKYLLKTGTYSSSTAYCDMETDGGGWTVIMRRSPANNSYNFDRYYHEYEDGFGELDDEFWFGLRSMKDITSRTHYEMRFDMFNAVNDTESAASAFYKLFRVEGDNYTLKLGNFNSSDDTLIDNLMQFNNRPFLAKVAKRRMDCKSFKGGWWFAKSCTAGPLQTPGILPTVSHGLVEWYDLSIKAPKHPARTFQRYEMKIRPRGCRVVEHDITQ